MDIQKTQSQLRQFSQERDWEQFHTPKNLVMALAVESAELLELFQWSNSGGREELEDAETRRNVEDEVADVFNYILRIADVLKIDLEEVSKRKIENNAQKYPVGKSKGKSTKYTKL